MRIRFDPPHLNWLPVLLTIDGRNYEFEATNDPDDFLYTVAFATRKCLETGAPATAVLHEGTIRVDWIFTPQLPQWELRIERQKPQGYKIPDAGLIVETTQNGPKMARAIWQGIMDVKPRIVKAYDTEDWGVPFPINETRALGKLLGEKVDP